MGVIPPTDITPKQHETIATLLQRHLPGVKVWAYGSRAKWISGPRSDIDLVVFTGPKQQHQVGYLREAFEESNLPFRVDLFVWDEVPESFRDEIKKSHVLFSDFTQISVPEDWREIPFAQAVQINPRVQLDSGQNYPYVDMAAVNVHSKFVYTSVEREFKGSGSRFRDGDILMARITPCLENGKVALYRTSQQTPLAHGSTEFIVIRGRPDITDNDFAYYLTQWDLIREYAISQMIGTSGRQRVPIESLSHLAIPLPPLSEQRAIAHILGTLDDKIELNRRMNETLEAMARAIFKDWFVDFGPTRAKTHGREPYLSSEIWKLFPDALDDEDKPVGWARMPLDEIADFLNGLALQKFPALYPDNSLPVIKIAELRSGITPKSNRASRDVPHKHIVRDGDFLFSWSGSLLAKFWTEGEGALNQDLFKVTSNRFPSWFFSQWVYHYLEQFRAIAASKATTMGHIQRCHLKEAMTVFPPDGVLASLGQIIGPLIALTIKNNLESRTLTKTRDFLLPRLMSGEVRLPEVEKAVETVA